MNKQRDLEEGMLTWIEYYRLGDKAVLDVPEEKTDFILPPGTYVVEISCICSAFFLAVVLQPIEDEGRYVRMRMPRVEGVEDAELRQCPPRRRAICERDGLRRQYAPLHSLTELDKVDPSTWMVGIKHDTKYASGTRKLNW